MGRGRKGPSAEDLAAMERPPDATIRRHAYKEAFISSPKLGLRTVQVLTISDGILILEALGEGRLMVATAVRDPRKGFFEMAEAKIEELAGKSKQEIYTLLDRRTDDLIREFKRRGWKVP